MADEKQTHINHLIENGLENVLKQEVISCNTDARPKDRIQCKATYDYELLADIQEFVERNKLFINDVIDK